MQGWLRFADRHPSPSNLVVSNVAGPRQPLYWSASQMLDLYSAGPLSEGIGLNITVWSYCGRMYVGAIACARALPDLDKIVQGLHEELAILVAETAQAEAAHAQNSSATG